MNKEQKADQINPIEVSEDSLTEVMNDNPNMEGNIEIAPGNYISSQSLIEKYQRIKNELKEKKDYIEVLEGALIELADDAYHRGKVIREMIGNMTGCISCQVGEAMRPSNKSGNQS